MDDIGPEAARRWISGENVQDAVRRAKEDNGQGLYGLINYLGEHSSKRAEVQRSVREYFKILRAIDTEGVRSSVSVKPTQMGLLVGEDYFRKNIEAIGRKATSRGIFMWIDMENSQYTQITVDTYLALSRTCKNLGICLQAYMRRSLKDMESILGANGIVRLCKGAYDESPEVVFKSASDINSSFLKLMKMMLTMDAAFAIATHDEELVRAAIKFSREYPSDFEFQMLMGVREDLKFDLIRKGFKVREYIPYGSQWQPYVHRRFMEENSRSRPQSQMPSNDGRVSFTTSSTASNGSRARS
ncbi:MAG TPA: proline dehydrogenase family protein [Candidatus Bathyarchaeia archaeon]|nr:proline dehydrogenase family protein [Candidatus Bathyarchaeia archaeon]